MPVVRMPRIVTGIQAIDEVLETWARAIESSLNWTAHAPLKLTANNGVFSVASERTATKAFKLTLNNSDGSYQATEVYGTTGGAWATVPGGFSGKIWEVNQYNNLDVTVVVYIEAWQDKPTGEWRFYGGSC